MNRSLKAILIGFLITTNLFLTSTKTFSQLDKRFLRNGECYLQIAEGPLIMRGIFRLNNAESGKRYKPSLYLFTPDEQITFFVDLQRNILSFRQICENSAEISNDNLYNQAPDSHLPPKPCIGFQLWQPDDISEKNPSYISSYSPHKNFVIIAKPFHKRTDKLIHAGKFAEFQKLQDMGHIRNKFLIGDIAFSPNNNSQPARTYFFSRQHQKPDFEVFLNGKIYQPEADNAIIGNPYSPDTFWIKTSTRNKSSDHIYALGTSVINDWYESITGDRLVEPNITSIAVSNQWYGNGGVIFACDSRNRMIYRFGRNEISNSPLSPENFESIPIASILKEIGATDDAEIDDINTDGFANLYFALSHPGNGIEDYDPVPHFTLNDSIHLYVPDWEADIDGQLEAYLLYRQSFAKKVYKKSSQSGKISLVGSREFSQKYFNIRIRASRNCLIELTAAGSMPHNKTEAILASWSAEIGESNIFSPESFAAGSLGLFYEFDNGNLGRSNLAVINIPTPPEVKSFEKKLSYLDIIGPYKSIPGKSIPNRHTNQAEGLIFPSNVPLSVNQPYFFMVENYPLADNPQDPNLQPDWDKDGRRGGFITALTNPASSAKGGRVFYRWRIWMVEDQFGNPACMPLNEAKPFYDKDTQQYEYFKFQTPVAGKFILTCHVTYDWYDYEKLNFGDSVEKLALIKQTGQAAIPAGIGSNKSESSEKILEKIMQTEPFTFMYASASTYLSKILEGGNQHLAMVSIQATDTPQASQPAFFCDIQINETEFDNSGIEVSNIITQTENAFSCCLSPASQSVLFLSIPRPSPFSIEQTHEMLFRNRFSQDNQRNPDLRWLEPSIRVTAYLEFTTLTENRKVRKEKIVVDLAPESPQTHAIIPASPENFPIRCLFALQPISNKITDARLVITMQRMFEYSLWNRKQSGSEWIWTSYLNLPGEITVTGSADLKIDSFN